MTGTSGKCFLCLAECETRCDRCDDDVYFCCDAHGDLHRGGGGGSGGIDCAPFRVSHRDGVGRCLVATRDVPAGELVFVESPLLVGPMHDTRPVCLSCFRPADGSFSCPRCSLPMCGARCAGDEAHAGAECAVLAGARVAVGDFDSGASHPVYQCVTPLRCLVLRERRPDGWRAMQQMMDHLSDKPRDLNWEMVQNNVVKYLLENRGLRDKYTEEEVNHVVGALEVNAFEVEPEGGGKGRGVFPLTALMSHSCVANTRYTMHGDCRAECRTNVEVRAGEEFTDYYVSPLHGSNYRRASLRDGWFFHCRCERCQDPTELETYLDAFRCQRRRAAAGEEEDDDQGKCGGAVVSTDALDFEADFRCGRCGHRTPRAVLEKVEDQIGESLEEADKNDREAMELLLEVASPLLHSSNYLILQMKQHLCYVYGHESGHLLHELSEELVERKRLFCRELLGAFDVLAPGLSKERGLALFELFSVEYYLLKKRLKAASKDDAKGEEEEEEDIRRNWSLAESCSRYLSECRRCLAHERDGTFERQVAAAAAGNLAKECAELVEVLALLKRHCQVQRDSEA